MKKILLTAFAIVCISAISLAQQPQQTPPKKITKGIKKSDSEKLAAKKLMEKKKTGASSASQIISPSGERKEVNIHQ